MFGLTVGPGTIAPDDKGTEFAYRLEASQKYPWPGKLKLRGENALAEARAASGDVDDMRLQLVESAKTAFYDYYLVARALAVNEETLQRLGEFRKDAEALYRTPPKEPQSVVPGCGPDRCGDRPATPAPTHTGADAPGRHRADHTR